MAVKLREGLGITAEDIYAAEDLELKRQALERYGERRFLDELQAEMLDEDGPNQLVRVREHCYLFLQDPSTDRRYLLRVPAAGDRGEITGVRQGVAWTFDLPADKYAPLIET